MGSDGIYAGKAKSKRCIFRYFFCWHGWECCTQPDPFIAIGSVAAGMECSLRQEEYKWSDWIPVDSTLSGNGTFRHWIDAEKQNASRICVSSLANELRGWRCVWIQKEPAGKTLPDTMKSTLGYADEDCFPNIRILLILGCTLPITSAEAE